MRTSAQTRHSIRETIIRKAKERIRGKADKNSTANPSITEHAFITIPLPMLFSVVVILPV